MRVLLGEAVEIDARIERGAPAGDALPQPAPKRRERQLRRL
jgi:hypothetical protein